MNPMFDIRIKQGMRALEEGDFSRALRIFNALEKEGCVSPDLLEGIGRADMMAGRSRQAINYFRKALQANPNLLTSRIGLGLVLFDLGETAEAIGLLKDTLDCGDRSNNLSPKARNRLVEGHLRLADMYVELDLSLEAVREYEKAIRIGGDYPDIRRKMAREYIRMNLLKDAERELKRALRRNPFFAEARADLGYLYRLQGKVDLASEEWAQAELDERADGLVWAYSHKGDGTAKDAGGASTPSDDPVEAVREGEGLL